jgi:hypothetical protein
MNTPTPALRLESELDWYVPFTNMGQLEEIASQDQLNAAERSEQCTRAYRRVVHRS